MGRRPRTALLCAVVALGIAGGASAFYAAPGSGMAVVSAQTLSAPQSVSASVSGSTVTVTWSAATISSSVAATGYAVERYDSSGNDLGPASCSPVDASTGNPNAFGTFTCSDLPGGGVFQYVVTAQYGSSWTTSAPPTSTVTVTSGTAVTAAAPTTGTTNTQIAASALTSKLSGATAPVSGTITFTVFGPQSSAPTSCTSGGTTVDTVSVSGNGTYSPSKGYTPSSAGNYYWYASYSGDGINVASTSACKSTMTKTVVKNATTTTLAVPSSATAATTIPNTSIMATLAGAASAASGKVSFFVFGPSSSPPTTCTSGYTKSLSSTAASGPGTVSPPSSYAPPSAGTYYWYASFAGDATDLPSNSGCGAGMTSTTVGPASPTVSISSPTSGKAGVAISSSSISSLISTAASPTGMLTFTVFGPLSSPPTDCSSGGTTVGTASVSGSTRYYPSAGYTPPSAGNYYFYAAYSGDSNNNPSNSGCGSGNVDKVTVTSTTSTVAGPATDTVNTAIPASAFSSTLSGGGPTVTGTITYTLFGPQTSAPSSCTSGGTTIGTATVNGTGTYSPSAGFTPSAIGDYWLYASYGGDATSGASSNACGSTMPELTVWSATAAALGSATTGTTVVSGSFSISPSTTYLLLLSRHSSASDSLTAVTSSGLSPTLTKASFTSITSQTHDTGDYEWAYRIKTSSSASGTGTLTATFANPLAAGQAGFLGLVALGGDYTSGPVNTNIAVATADSGSASANLPSAPAAPQNAMVAMLTGDASLGSSAPTATGLTTISTSGGAPAYFGTSAGSFGLYSGIPAQQSSTFSAFPSQGWGTVAFELKHG